MFDISKYFTGGRQNSLLVKNNSGFTFNGPWIGIYQDTLLDRWYIGDFSSAEYTISIDYDTSSKEILKCLVVGTIDKAKLNVYSRLSTNTELVEIYAVVNDSYVDVIVKPKSNKLDGSKAIFTANYFHNQSPL